MARSIEARLARLEAPQGNPASNFAMLKALHQVLTSINDTPMPTDAELWEIARTEGRPDFTAALVAVWEDQAHGTKSSGPSYPFRIAGT